MDGTRQPVMTPYCLELSHVDTPFTREAGKWGLVYLSIKVGHIAIPYSWILLIRKGKRILGGRLAVFTVVYFAIHLHGS